MTNDRAERRWRLRPKHMSAFAVVSAMYLLTIFFRPLRVLSQALTVVALWDTARVLECLRRSALVKVCIGIGLVLAFRFLLGLFLGEADDLGLALRQLGYYFFLPLGTLASLLALSDPRTPIFALPVVIAAAGEYLVLSLLFEAEFAGDWQIRGSFEAGTVYFLLAAVALAGRNTAKLIVVLCALSAFAIFTNTSQGVVAAIMMLPLFVRPIPKRLLIVLIGSLPISLPFLVILLAPMLGHLDTNAMFRVTLWSSFINSYAADIGILGLGFGLPIYLTVMNLGLAPYVRFSEIDNIGMHNEMLQLVAFSGVVGTVLIGALCFVATRIALRNRTNPVVLSAFVVSMVSLANNQAVSHFAVAFGLYLALGVLATAELDRGRSALD